MIVLLAIVMYLVLAAITGGAIQAVKDNGHSYSSHWDTGDSFWVGMGWPFSWIWYGFLKPIAKLTIRAVQWKVERKRIRVKLREEKQRVERQRIAEIDEMMAREEEERHQARA